MYVRAGAAPDVAKITAELATAENIKSKNTRKDVQCALRRLRVWLADNPKLPPNGVGLFSSANEALIAVTPDLPIGRSDYVCAKEFDVDPALAKFVHHTDELYGWAVVTGEKIHYEDSVSKRKTFSRPGGKIHSHNKGGQSAPRFQRQFIASNKAWFQEAWEWLQIQVAPETIVVFVTGPGVEARGVPDQLGKTRVTTVTGDGSGFAHRVQEELIPEDKRQQSLIRAKKCWEMMQLNPEMVCAGLGPVNEALNQHAVKQLWIERRHRERFEPWSDVLTVILVDQALPQFEGVFAELYFSIEFAGAGVPTP